MKDIGEVIDSLSAGNSSQRTARLSRQAKTINGGTSELTKAEKDKISNALLSGDVRDIIPIALKQSTHLADFMDFIRTLLPYILDKKKTEDNKREYVIVVEDDKHYKERLQEAEGTKNKLQSSKVAKKRGTEREETVPR